MKAYFLFEWKLFWKNKKNQGAIVLLFFAMLVYTLLIVPTYTHFEEVTIEGIEEELAEGIGVLEDIDPDTRSRDFYFYQQITPINQARYSALVNEDYLTYIEETMTYFGMRKYPFQVHPQFYEYGDLRSQEKGDYHLQNNFQRYRGYLDYQPPLTVETLNGQTALQTLQRALNNGLAYILLGLVMIFAMDSVVKDYSHKTLIESAPLTLSKRYWTKTVVVFSATFLTVFALLFSGLTLVGVRYGWGSWLLPVAQNAEPGDVLLSMSQLLVQQLIFFIILTVVFIRVIFLWSILIKNEFFNLIAGMVLLFSEFLYFKDGIGFFTNLDILPFTFFDFGSALSGYKNLLYTTDSITFKNGLISVGILFITIEILLLAVMYLRKTLRKNRQ
ncbi:ABC transporter permease [Lacticigenium naphthae]|uniref:ABC transporter permease n=1 Tax=Lacticigenium naphthae TaxID=515351 RepID=UPI0004056D97|nr:ABC transporter permease [Lacticigenium naphthae]